jgi:hypothetical protein
VYLVSVGVFKLWEQKGDTPVHQQVGDVQLVAVDRERDLRNGMPHGLHGPMQTAVREEQPCLRVPCQQNTIKSHTVHVILGSRLHFANYKLIKRVIFCILKMCQDLIAINEKKTFKN